MICYLYTSKYRNVSFCNVLACGYIQKAERFMYYLIPWLYFYRSCKKETFVCLYHCNFLFVVQAKACSKQTQLYFLWFAESKMYCHSQCVFILLWFICSCWSSCQGFLWLIQQSSSDWSLPLVYLRSQFEVKGKKKASLSWFKLYCWYSLF